MLPRSLRCLCLCLAVMITASVDPSGCHQSFSRRNTPSFSAFSHHRFARRSSPRLSNLHRRSSIPINKSPSLAAPRGTSGLANHSRRSIDLDQFDNDPTSQSLDQQRDEAGQLWEEFVDADAGEDLDSYLDCDESKSTPAFYTGSSESPTIQPLGSASLTSTSDNGKTEPPSKSQKQQSSKVQSYRSNDDEDEVKSGDQDQKTKEAAQKAKQAKEKAKAEAEKLQDADDTAQKQKDQEAAEAQKEQEAAEAKKEQEAAEAKKEQEAADATRKAKKQKAEYVVSGLKKIPGTSVTTGTAKPKNENDDDEHSSGSSEEHTGDATFFTPDTGACGVVNTSSDYIVAVSHLLYDSFPSQGGNPNTNAICHKKIRASYQGCSVVVTVTDRCEGCDMYSLDFTESAFQELGSKDRGRLHGMTWTFV